MPYRVNNETIHKSGMVLQVEATKILCAWMSLTKKIKNGLDESGPRARRPLVGPVLTALSSHRFFKARLRAGSSLEDLLIQIGHLFVGSALHQLFRQPLQNLWLRDRRTGSVKMLWHTGQWRSSSDLEAIEFLSEAENWKYSQSWLFSLLLT